MKQKMILVFPFLFFGKNSFNKHENLNDAFFGKQPMFMKLKNSYRFLFFFLLGDFSVQYDPIVSSFCSSHQYHVFLFLLIYCLKLNTLCYFTDHLARKWKTLYGFHLVNQKCIQNHSHHAE